MYQTIHQHSCRTNCTSLSHPFSLPPLNNSIFTTQPACPVCHVPLTIDLDAPALEVNEDVATARQGILGRLDVDKWRSSTKIEALIEELTILRQKDATTKSLVFSQFVNFLDLIAFRLQRAGISSQVEAGTSSHARVDPSFEAQLVSIEKWVEC